MALVTLDQLKAVTGYEQPSAVERCLRKNGVRFLYGRDGVYTTTDALNAAMGIIPGTTPAKTEQEFDIL